MLCRIFLAIMLAVAVHADAALADFRWPPLAGELSGVVRLDALGSGWPIAWRTKLHPVAGGAPQLDLALSAQGFALQAIATPPVGDAPGTWHVSDGLIELAAGLPVAVSHVDIATLPPDLAMTGNLRFSGDGTWRDTDFSGQITLTLSDATTASVQQNWSASGLSLTLEAVLTKNIPAVRSSKLTIDTFKVAGLTSRHVVVEAVGIAGGKLEVRRAEVEMLGGRVALTPFTLDPAAPSVETNADLVSVALGELAALMPQALTAASGQLAGRISMRWSAKAGAEAGAGTLRIASDSPATVNLAERAGFLTQNIPPRFYLAGNSLGPLSRALSLENPAYDTLRRIELGQLPIVVDGLEVKLYPDGPDGAVSARVELSGHPAEAKSAVGAVSFSVNVAGPLSQVLRLGMQKNASMSLGAGR